MATGAPNSCSHAHLDVFNLDKCITSEKKYSPKNEIGPCGDDCLALWTGPFDKLELFLMFLKSIDSNLQLTVEAGGNKLCFYVFMNYVFRFKVNFKG